MFDIHLAWSPIGYLIGFAWILLFIILLFRTKLGRSLDLSMKLLAICVVTALMNLWAWDVGTRQSELGRSAFNAAPPAHIEKVEVERLTRDKVRVEFEATIDEHHKEVEQ